jgi:hypothetical protein
MLGFSLQSLSSMGGLYWRVVRGILDNGVQRWRSRTRSSWASHDVGRLSGGQSPAIHHFQGPQVVRRQEEVQGDRGLVGLGKEAFPF